MADHRRNHGRAIPFGVSVLTGEHYEQIEPYAFNIFLRLPDRDVTLVWDTHEAAAPILASTANRSLELWASPHGLEF
jgi:hypothetical protein